MQQLKDMTTAENAGVITGKPETMFEHMLNAIRDSLSDLASSKDEEDGEDKDDDEDDTELGKLSEDDEPGWVMATISKTVQHRMESFRQKQMRLDELTQPGWGHMADYFDERDMKYGTTELKVPAVGKPQTDMTAATPLPTTLGDLMQALDIISGQSQSQQVTSAQGSSQMRLGSEKPLTDNHIVPSMPNAVPNLSQVEIAKPVQPVSFYPCI